MKRRNNIIAIAGIAVAAVIIAAVAAYAFTPLGAEVVVTSGSQFVPWNVEWYTTHSEKVAIGRIVSVEVRQVDESVTSNNTQTGETIVNEVKKPYQFVTIAVEKYLKDAKGDNPQQLTFRDYASGIGVVDGKKALIETEVNVEYKIGERAVFFIDRVNGDLFSNGVVSKLTISEAKGTAQSIYMEKAGIAPTAVSKLEADVRSVMAG